MTYPPPNPGQEGPYTPPPAPGGPAYPPPADYPPAPGYPPSPGYGSPYENDQTNGMSVAAFITGLLGCFGILGLILGIVSLRQISARGGKGRGFAIAGIVLSCLWVAVTGVAYAVGATMDLGSSPSPSSSSGPGTSPTKTGEVDARTMKVGDCINDSKVASSTAGESVEVESVKIVPCTGPHDGEVMATFPVTRGSMPPEQEMMQLASTGCEKRLTSKIRRDPAADSLSMSYYYPTSGSWRLGDRHVTCVVVSATEGKKLTRPIRRS